MLLRLGPFSMLLVAFLLAPVGVSTAQEQAKPYMLLVLDTSGSMQGSKITNAKGALADAVQSSGEVVYALQRFKQACTGACNCVPAPSPRLEMCDNGRQCQDNTACTQDVDCAAVGDRVCVTRDADGCSADCRSNESCANRIVDWSVGEECDDGNLVSGDGCDASCRWEPLPACGDGAVSAGEACDNGRQCQDGRSCSQDSDCAGIGDGVCITRDLDGCSADCRSNESCGNGVVDVILGEECDDGGQIPGDGCGADCRREIPPTCGDGVAAPAPAHNPGCAGEWPIVELGADNQMEILSWVDGVCDFGAGNPELVIPTAGTAWTPLAASLDMALWYFRTVFPQDPYWGCRPYYVILLTDGDETCGGDPAAAAARVYRNGIRTLVIGFGVTQPDAQLDAIATAGGTGPSAVYVEVDRAALALAFMNIVVDSVLVEVCNDVDDDCNCPGDTNNDGTVCGPGDQGVDEGFDVGAVCNNGQYGVCYAEGVNVCRADRLGTECNAPSMVPPENPEVSCDGLDNDCDCLADTTGDCPGDTNGDGLVCGPGDDGVCGPGDYNVDEGVVNACGDCGPVPPEVCNWLDDDCNGIIDDVAQVGLSCAHPEAPGPVGNEGTCELGALDCVGDELACVGAVGPVPEVCDCLDNDCDGATDEVPGTGGSLCTGAAECLGAPVCWCASPCDLSGDTLPCPIGYFCEMGRTPPLCIPDECTRARCPEGLYCRLDAYCICGAAGCDCAAAGCQPGQYLHQGVCYDTPCFDLCDLCRTDQRCVKGECFDDNCYNFPEYCAAGELCLNAVCTPDPCASVECLPEQFCRGGGCIDSCAYVNCAAGHLCKDGECYPHACASRKEPCPEGTVCGDNGECVSDPCLGVNCGPKRTCLDGECTDDLCRYIHCPAGAVCRENDCVAPVERNFIITAGSGGCACAAGTEVGTTFPVWFLLVALLSFACRRNCGRKDPLKFFLVVVCGAGLVGIGATGCTKEPVCVDCHECVVDLEGVASITDPGTGEVVLSETRCDWIDNDCDCPGDTDGDGWYCDLGDEGVDEDFDTSSDTLNCGVCGNVCRLDNAFPKCEAGACRIDSCVVGYYDIDQDPTNGCEYACTLTNNGLETCDGVDNDCDCPGDTNRDGCYCCGGDLNVDEDIPGLGAACGSDVGACDPGTVACQPEACDDANQLDGDGCSADCRSDESCGNGIVDVSVGEECDDRNTVSWDGCSASCRLEVSATCGDGNLDAGEVCDDLNLVDGDGCSANCLSNETCGNGIVDVSRGEECDDQNLAAGDGCDESCRREITADCGNGTVGSSLACLGGVRPQLEVCDDQDNDCNGVADEIFPTKGDACFSGVGVCRMEGVLRCNASRNGVYCAQLVLPYDPLPPEGDLSQRTNEVWNGLDDDCDGGVDEDIPAIEEMVHIAFTHPTFGALDFWIYRYEASRPDATQTSTGSIESRPFSQPGALPWSLVTWQGANNACLAAGKRLCTELEWQATCESDEIRSWPYGSLYAQDSCNDNLHDFNPGTPQDEDGAVPTGFMNACVSKDGVLDLSGNLKEWTATEITGHPGARRIRGGSFDNVPDGTRCQFDFSAAEEPFVFGNLGFRCCSDIGP